MTVDRFYEALTAVRAAGYGGDVDWAENVKEPVDAIGFAQEAIFVICNSGMRFTVAQSIYRRVIDALNSGNSASTAFGHKGKTAAIDDIWKRRDALMQEYMAAWDKIAFCESLPWIGGITKYHLAKNFGVDVAKPDVHLQRLADHEGTTPQELCSALASATGFRVSTVDVVLWRACAIGAIHSGGNP